ncbi:MAG TPA: polysaccharide deacetylase family protein [Pseudolabrys sp.]|nr:polysaccharide deacetylase family protein [Pseudolabrys sp.]
MRAIAVFFWLLASTTASFSSSCPDNPNALGTSRVLTIGPEEFARIGRMQYEQTLPLGDHEVVLTFDDGPIPPYSNVVLETLASQCIKATYFLVGEMARAHPAIVRRIYNAGHTIGTHSQNHPYRFRRLSASEAEQQIDSGIASVDAALGNPQALSPFFRIPGLGRTPAIENYLASKSIVIWSADVVADDWKHIGAREIVQRAMRRLEAKGRGILLLHDIHPATAVALPMLLKELKDHGYRIVQVVAAGDRPPSVPELAIPHESMKEARPAVLKAKFGKAHVHTRTHKRVKSRQRHPAIATAKS